MKLLTGWAGLLCLLLTACSHPMLTVERPTADGYLKVVELSNDGQVVETGQNQVKLPYPVAGKSDIIVRGKYIYVGSYRHLYCVEQDLNGNLRVMSSLQIEGHEIALALHPEDNIIYVCTSKGIWVVDAENVKAPRVVRHLTLADGLGENKPVQRPEELIATDVACEDGKLVVTIQGLGQSQTSSRGGTTIVFDVTNPIRPQAERVLDNLPGAGAIAMGLFNHQMFIAGDRVIEYKDFKKEEFGSGGWLRKPGLTKYAEHVRMPGQVVDLKFIMGSRAGLEFPRKRQRFMTRYRHAEASERRRLQDLMPLDDGVLYIATEHAITYMDTAFKVVLWGPNNKNEYVSEYFNRISGMDARDYSYVYLAPGADGVSILKRRPSRYQFDTLHRFKDLPSPALDVCVTDGKLYLLCGELRLKNIQHNESIRPK